MFLRTDASALLEKPGLKRPVRTRIGLIALAALLSASAPAFAGCDDFAWPVTTEVAWMNAGKIQLVNSGETLKMPPEAAMSVVLRPAFEVKLPVPPSGRLKKVGVENYSGFVKFDSVAKPGLYQVSVSGTGWIDVVQNGATLKPIAETEAADCMGVRKSIRFEIGDGPISVQFSFVPRGSIRVTVRPAE